MTTSEQAGDGLRELRLLKQRYDALLQALEAGILLVDNDDQVIAENGAMRQLWQIERPLQGCRFSESMLARMCPQLVDLVEQVRDEGRSLQMDCPAGAGRLAVTVKAVRDEGQKDTIAVLIHAQGVGPEQHLQDTLQQLQTAAEAVQSTSDELEVASRELQSLTEDLEDINEELAQRSKELDELSARYSEMVERMPWPMLLANDQGQISVYNSAAQKLFGFATPSDRGMSLQQLPMAPANRVKVIQRFKQAVQKNKPTLLEDLALVTNSNAYTVNVQINPLSPVGNDRGILVMFEQRPGGVRRGAAKGKSSAEGKKKAAKIKKVKRKK